jgi:hypothetical protein
MSTFIKHDGSTQPEKIAAPVSHRSHGFAAEVPAKHGGKPNIARDASRGKAVRETPFHGGMHKQSTDKAGLGGQGHAVSHVVDGATVVVDGGNTNPLSKPPPPKTAHGPLKATLVQRF